MLEGLVTWVLNTYLGEYVEDLSIDQLSIGLLQGEVELDNLPLKRDALKKFNFPLEVKSGFIGKVHLQIPVSRLKSQPWVITLDKFYLVAGPIKHSQYNEEEEKVAAEKIKQAQLAALEEKWKAERQAAADGSAGSWWSLGTSLASNILENLQMKVREVHLRYEDDVTIPNMSFACGVIIKSLSMQSTNSDWAPMFVNHSDTDMIHKLVDLQDLSLYWDTDTRLVGSLQRSQMEESLQKGMSPCAHSTEFMDHCYLLAPVCAQAKLRRNTSVLPLRSPHTPRITLDLELEDFTIGLSDRQYRGMFAWAKEFDRFDRMLKYRRWRPLCTVAEDPRRWWHFAIDSQLHVIRERNMRYTVQFLERRARQIAQYADVYTEFITIGLYYMDEDMKKTMKEIEEEWSFSELKIVREATMKRIVDEQATTESSITQTSTEPPAEPAEPTKGGIFQSWFPGWAGWGSAQQADVQPTQTEETFEKQIMDVLVDTPDNNTLLKRDTVLAHLNFCLKSGTFKLLSKRGSSTECSSIVEMECTAVELSLESRPRSKGLKFSISVGGLFLHDHVTSDSIMPLLVAPQQRERGRHAFSTAHSPDSKLRPSSFFSMLSTRTPVGQALFQLVFEQNPIGSGAHYRLEVNAKPLNIVYNAATIKRIQEFFERDSSSQSGDQIAITRAAKLRYEELKRQTQAELKQTLEQFLEGDGKIKARRWDFEMDISAPQIIIAEDLTNFNTTMVVFDLGRLHFHNTAASVQADPTANADWSDDENFVTPSSSPPNERESDKRLAAEELNERQMSYLLQSQLSAADIYDKIYDRYTLQLCDVQVMVASGGGDQWKQANSKGSSPQHVVDKFNIRLQLERRLLYTSDSRWPKTSLSGTMPSLVLHVNEVKIQALKSCIQTLLEKMSTNHVVPVTANIVEPDARATVEKSKYLSNMYNAYNSHLHNFAEETEKLDQSEGPAATESRILVQFDINQLSLEIQSRGRSIIELRVAGVKANYVMRPYDTSLSFSIHSLLVVDALQTFGPDFELLVASHKNISLDSRSGSLLDSDPNSPTSPMSPNFPASPAEPARFPVFTSGLLNVQSAVSSALQALVMSDESSPRSEPYITAPTSMDSLLRPHSPVVDNEALIKVELDMVSPSAKDRNGTDETLRIANIQINNLDFIANQQTLLELLRFLRSVGVDMSRSPKKGFSAGNMKDLHSGVNTNISKEGGSKWEVTSHFQHLNMMAVKVLQTETSCTAIKIATATMSQAMIQATIASSGDLDVHGSLGGLQLLDLNADARRHQQVFSVGHDPSTSDRTAIDSSEHALTFQLSRPGDATDVSVVLRLASLCYTHSPYFLQQLSSWAVEFREHFAHVGDSLRQAATEMALGLVQKDLLVIPSSEPKLALSSPSSLRLRLDAVLQTPVVILPQSATSSEVLVLHLGRIHLDNGATVSVGDSRVELSACDMTMYSVDLNRQSSLKREAACGNAVSAFSTPQPGGFTQTNYGTPILHNTSIQLSVLMTSARAQHSGAHVHFDESRDEVHISGKVVTPLSLVVSKHVYHQLLNTLHNLTPPDNPQQVSFTREDTPSVTLPSPANSEPSSESSLSSSSSSSSSSTRVVTMDFEMPTFQVELTGDLGEGEKGFLAMTFDAFRVNLTANSNHTKHLDVSLRSLVVEDLLEEAHSSHRQLVVSYASSSASRDKPSRQFYSTSCPISMIDSVMPGMPNSLPIHFMQENVFSAHAAHSVHGSHSAGSIRMNNGFSGYPSPRSVQHEDSVEEDLLVHIKVLLVDKQAADFASVYNKTNRFVTVDFKCLDTTINLQTWVVLLDFLGLGANIDKFKEDPEQTRDSPDVQDLTADISEETREVVNTNMEVSVQSLSLLLNKSSYELATASVSGIACRVVMRDGDFSLSGQLASMSVTDASPHGMMYRERFITHGSQALDFDFFKYGTLDEAHDYDMRVKLRMSSVCYLHTQRFVQETLAFCQHFNQLQDVLGRMRAASAGHQISSHASRSARLSIDVEAGAPIILIPHSSCSADILVVDLGTLTVRNTFQLERDAEHARCGPHRVVDRMDVALVDMDLYSAEWHSTSSFNRDVSDSDGWTDGERDKQLQFPSYSVHRKDGILLENKFCMQWHVVRQLERNAGPVADVSISGVLSCVRVAVDRTQLKLVRGLLSHNLGEPLEDQPRLQHSMPHTVLSSDVWKTMSVSLSLHNVTAELIISHAQDGSPQNSLAQFDFIKSGLLFDSFSDGSKNVDLVSHEILIHDTRYRDIPANTRPNVFSHILQPSGTSHNSNSLQMELHYRSTKSATRFTVLLNNMRVMGIFDWLLSVQNILLTPLDDPFQEGNDDTEMLLYTGAATCENEPKAISSGVLTKRASRDDARETPFELKLNVTNTEFVVVDNTTTWDTNAVVLKSTAVLSFSPQSSERILSCILQSLEVFSCCLASEDETALSIIDPMTFNIELNSMPLSHQRASEPIGLLDATGASIVAPVLEVNMSTLNIRLSYNDMRLFMDIMDSMPKQLLMAREQMPCDEQQQHNASQLRKLTALGYSEADCQRALVVCHDNLEEASMWLMENGALSSVVKTHFDEKKLLKISGVEVKADSICFCLIDDCRDTDVPLAEITFLNFDCLYKLPNHGKSHANFKLSGDYYNRCLSGWEPFLEPWSCRLDWEHHHLLGAITKVSVKADEVLNVNLTSTLLDLYNKTHSKWTEDYYKESQRINFCDAGSRRREPFVPFAIRNETGSELWFNTLIAMPTRIEACPSPSDTDRSQTNPWRLVKPGEELSFLIEEREKIRHKKTHELKVHQLLVKILGWKEVSPVSVDKVGIYFREAKPETEKSSAIFYEVPPARIVFDVSVEGSAKKVITVRSALVVHNRMNEKLQIRLENTLPQFNMVEHKFAIKPDQKVAIPLKMVHCKVWVRPADWSVDWSRRAVMWQHVIAEQCDSFHECHSQVADEAVYRFCACVHRLGYPPDQRVANASQKNAAFYAQPAHLISLMPPLRICNLLPADLIFYLKGTDIRDTIKAEKMASLVTVDIAQSLELGVTMENFTSCKELLIPAGTSDYKVKLRLYDSLDRLLELWVLIKAGTGGSLKLSISAPYWLVNKSGLPLVFKQDGCSEPAAGQFEEHELARSVTPLAFCYARKEQPNLCVMRLGKSVNASNTVPQWCYKFSLERGIGVRELHITPNDNRPDWVYNIGIEVRQGRGRYCGTNLVTFTPRYQLDNRSRYKLAFAQRHLVTAEKPDVDDYLSALSNCTLSFHWPRVDLDQLLCVRIMSLPHCFWSGGFRLDAVDSFHINMRGEHNECIFLRVDVILQGATFFTVFTDADQMPPPYRIDNFSQVPLLFFQTKVSKERLQTHIKAASSIPYAWDEPSLPPYLTVSVSGGSSATYNMHALGEGEQLCYENFIYIIFTRTFRGNNARSPGWPTYDSFVESQELVLDVIHENKVVLKKKEAGRRSQLWRMTSAGLLQHEGSSAPHDPRLTRPAPRENYVLDIDSLAVRPSRDTPLRLRKPDERRQSTQKWQFTQDGRLCCEASQNLCVQSKEGIFGLRDGGIAVLGQSSLGMQTEIPIEMCVSRQKMRPGSGFLAVKVLTDGPTRVLQVTDIRQQRYKTAESADWVMVEERRRRPYLSSCQPHHKVDKRHKRDEEAKEFEMLVSLKDGIGVSLVNKTPEELVYVCLRDIVISYSCAGSGQSLDASVHNIQIDNQLFGNYQPALLFVTPPSNSDSPVDVVPALHISAHKMPNHQWNTDIYRELLISVKRMTVQIEEKLLWKLLQFVGFNESDTEMENLDESSFNSQRALMAAVSAKMKRYYFGCLKINIGRITLSMLTCSELPDDLKIIKKSLGIPLVKFEDAKVELDPFEHGHQFETSTFLLESMRIHYTEELKGQAAGILGSVDFLGNPLGLFNDVTEGIYGLIDGNLSGLLKNVTHGVSNTAAKVTGSVSDGFGMLTFDDQHQRQRQQIRNEHTSRGRDHLIAGIRGLGHGLVGGAISIISQTYLGTKDKGIEGMLTGFSKGVVGTVTKPVAGVLDFASGAASAVRDTSRGGWRRQPPPVRPTRCCYGPGALLPPYCQQHADAQAYLFTLNQNNYSERFVAMEQLSFGSEDDMWVLISSEQVYFLGRRQHSIYTILLHVCYCDLYDCCSIPFDGKFYIDLTMKAVNEMGVPSPEPRKRPKVRCDSEAIACKVSRQILYAKNLFDEIKQTLQSSC